MSHRVELFASATFDADEVATATTEPVPVGQVYDLTSISVRTDLGDDPRTSATVYRNTASEPNQLDVSRRGGNGATTDVAVTLFAGERLVVVWEGGTAGAHAHVAAQGTGSH